MGAILAMESGSDLSAAACIRSEESERDEDPCERNFFWKSIFDQVVWSHRLRFHHFAISYFENSCPLTSSVLLFWLRCCCIPLENCISSSLIYTWSLTCLKLHKNFHQAVHVYFCKTGNFRILCGFGFYWTGITNWSSFLNFS